MPMEPAADRTGRARRAHW